MTKTMTDKNNKPGFFQRLMSFGHQPPEVLKDEPASRAELTDQVAHPTAPLVPTQATGQVRRAIDDILPAGDTPLAVLSQLKRAKQGDIQGFVKLVEAVISEDMNYASASEAVTEALTAAPLIAEPGGPLARDKKVAEDVQRNVLDLACVQEIVEHMLSYEDFGYAAAELMWDTSDPRHFKIANVVPVNPAWLTFDKRDARTPLLLPAESGGMPIPLKKNVFMYLALKGYGLPILRSHGYAGAFYKALKTLGLKDWAGLLEVVGQPVRVGSYDSTKLGGIGSPELKKSIKDLDRALTQLGTDAWARIPEGMKIEFLESSTKSASGELYERFTRYFDEQITKRKTGAVLTTGTGNTGSGGSQALGTVHGEAFTRKIRSIAKDIASCIQTGAVTAYVTFNYPEGTPVPKVRFFFEEPEDIAALSDALAKLVPLGLKVSQDEIRDKLGLREPADDEDTLGTAPPAEPDAPADPKAAKDTLRARFAATPASGQGPSEPSAASDELDALEAELLADEGYVEADDSINAELLALVEATAAEGPEAIKKALLAFIENSDVDGLRAVFTAGMTASRAAGDLGLELTDVEA